MPHCPECGADIKRGVKFCPDCGRRIARAATPKKKPARAATPKKKPTLVAPTKPKGRDRGKLTIALVIVCAILASFALAFFAYSLERGGKYNSLVDEYNELTDSYDSLADEFTQTMETLQQAIEELTEEFDSLADEFAQTIYELEKELEGAELPPYTSIENENVVWVFRKSDEHLARWTIPLETYVYYATEPKPVEYHQLTTGERDFRVRKMESFVQPELFEEVISGLTEGRDDKEFVAEVFSLRKQLTVYRQDITDTPLWSVETMTAGAGDCEDFAILMASLLEAGNEQANYGMQIQMLYMDTDDLTEPQGVNHVSLFVRYADSSTAFVDSTASVMDPFGSSVTGWYYDV